MSSLFRYFIILFLFFISVLSVRQAFAVVCGDYTFSSKYYEDTSAAWSAAVAFPPAGNYPASTYSDPSSSIAGQVAFECANISSGTFIFFKESYTFFVPLGKTCEFKVGTECVCYAEREALAVRCGVAGYNIDNETCQGSCIDSCSELRNRLSYSCGGDDQYWYVSQIDTDASGNQTQQCSGACGAPPDANRDTDGDGIPDTQDDDLDGDGSPNSSDDDIDGDGIPNASDTSPTVPGGFDKSQPPGEYGDQSADSLPDDGLPPPTFDCIEQWNNKRDECGDAGVAEWDNTTCTGRCNGTNPCTDAQMAAADAACPNGYVMGANCIAFCSSCDKIESDCIVSCSPAAVKTNFCEEQDGSVVDSLCECEKISACQQYRASCQQSCSQYNCGGIKAYQCQEDSTGRITSKTCECNDCEEPYVPPPDNPEPDDSDDLAGWLQGIKRDTEQIVDNTSSISQHVSGLKGSIDGLKNALSDVTMKGSGIGTLTGDGSLGTGASVTGSGYGTAPADGDLPGTTSFGTFTPRASGSAGDYGGQISAKLNTLSITASGAVCSFNLSYPVPRLSGLSLSFTWQNYLVNFCPYESLFVMIGNILVFFTALSELYKFA